MTLHWCLGVLRQGHRGAGGGGVTRLGGGRSPYADPALLQMVFKPIPHHKHTY